MNPDHYLTISGPSGGFYKEKGSKFIAFAFPVKNENDIKEHLKDLSKEYHDARHICYAYRLGIKSIYERANDDGEPGNSAGTPILGQIKSLNLTNTLVAVVRYFGGTKLGVGGLVNAYKTAAKDALHEGSVISELITKPISIVFPYEHTNKVMRGLDEFKVQQNKQSFTDECQIWGDIKENDVNAFIKLFSLNGDIVISVSE